PDESELLRALRLKSGRYSIERPLELGALLAGAPAGLLEGLKRYGQAVGDAFQLQDDVLGTFGEPAAVGKPVASDLEEGKYTFLVHHALAGAGPDDRAWLRGVLGRGELEPALEPSEIERARDVIRRSGGLDAVREMIDDRLDRARRSLEDLPLSAEHRELLLGLVDYLARRDR
ncbi:MAG: polyprenyl synthetase family protein, partial [Acidobacteriota bacterium]